MIFFAFSRRLVGSSATIIERESHRLRNEHMFIVLAVASACPGVTDAMKVYDIRHVALI
jgi:hypothetical protein